MSHKVTEKRASELFTTITPYEMKENPFQLMGREWFLMTAEKKDGSINTMTVGWGGFGVLWQKNVVFVAVRPERFTKEFLDESDTFSLTLFDPSFKRMLGYMGTVSGRTEDKIAKSSLTVVYDENTPYFEEAKMSITCKRIMETEFQEKDFNGKTEFTGKFYGGENQHSGEGGGYHWLYIAQITKILVKK